MNKRKVFKYLISAVLAILMVTLIVGSVTAFIIVPIVPFSDVPYNHWAVDYIWWVKNNGIAVGYPDGTYRPNNSITRAEMAVMVKKTASTVVAAGVHIERGSGNVPVIDRWFNNVNSTAPTVTGANGNYILNFQFDLSERFYSCTMDTNFTDTRDAVCSVNQYSSNEIRVRVYDTGENGQRAGEFWVLVYGVDIQP